MDFVSEIEDVTSNLKTLEKYLNSSNQNERTFAQDLIRRGKTILVYKVNGKNHFAPSRFCGYLNNTFEQHLVHEEKDGRETNPELDKVLKGKAVYTDKFEFAFLAYCGEMSLDVPANKRRYWRVGTNDNPYLDIAK